MKDITFIIKTFQRHHLLERLLKSIREFYPDVEILVCDDTGFPSDFIGTPEFNYGANVFYTPFDIGLSAGRNLLVSQVQTKYFLLLDDDFVFTKDTKIELLKEYLEKNNFDIVGGAIFQKGIIHHYEGFYRLRDHTLSMLGPKEDHRGIRTDQIFDFILNFFLAKTEKIKECRWDNKLKLAEHTAFFYRHRGKLRIGYQPECIVNHLSENIGEYKNYRKRAYRYYDIFLEEEGIKKVIPLKGDSYEVGDWQKWDGSISL